MLTIQIKDIFEISKYIDILKSDIKVMTPNGLSKIYDVDITSYNSDVIKLETIKHELMCSPDHLIKSNNKWIKAKDFRLNDQIDTKYGTYNIKKISMCDKKEDLLDLHVDGNEYYTNDILSHNSSLQETIDFSLFGLVRGKERKRIPLKELPNRINGSLLTSIKFINDKNDEIEIERGLTPQKLMVKLNGNEITSSYKKFTQEQKEEFVGMNYDIYKSFISMSFNDFTNFINLNPETKRKLLNRLFNLEELDRYYEITKNIIKSNNRSLEKLDIEHKTNINTIETYKENISKIKQISDNNIDTKDEIKEKILSKKSRFLELKDQYKNLFDRLNELNENLSNRSEVLNAKNHRLNKLEFQLDEINKRIEVFEKGRCPMCNTVLKSDKHAHNKNQFIEDRKELLEDIQESKKDVNEYKSESRSIYNERKRLLSERSKIKKEFDELGYELKSLKKEYDNYESNDSAIKEIEKNIENLKQKNKELHTLIKDIESKNSKYESLNELFSMTGLRKSMIQNIVKPINKYLAEYLEDMDSSYRVELNDEFDADIYERYVNKVHPESLSRGEARKVNIAIALSYLEIIRRIRKNNILFLDEVFDGIDMDNVDVLLRTMKKFAKKYNMNIIVVNHSPVDLDLFDRIISIDKKTFSMIKDEYTK